MKNIGAMPANANHAGKHAPGLFWRDGFSVGGFMRTTSARAFAMSGGGGAGRVVPGKMGGRARAGKPGAAKKPWGGGDEYRA